MPPSTKPDPVDWVSPETIRRAFNEGRYYERLQTGCLHAYLKRHSHCKRPPPGEPICTHSQILVYYDRHNQPVVVVHQYLRPDQTLGASGQPDPKWLIVGDHVMAVRSHPK
jgi:hypothetical protein